MEKEHQPDSMTTVNIKPEYTPSEVYSTSEPPPAYRQRLSNSVQIARIVAVTIVLSSFILGSFILASSWVSAQAGCQQLDQLDAMLDKELALEGRRYDELGGLPEELPIRNAHALHQEPTTSTSTTEAPKMAQPVSVSLIKDDTHVSESKNDENKLQKLDFDEDDSNDVDSSDSEEDDLDSRTNGVPFKLPVEFDLDDLAGAFLANNDMKGRMNCVVERRRNDPIESRFPFNLLQAITGKITGTPVNSEKVAIICHAGDEQRTMIPEPASQVFAFPLNGPPQMPMGAPRPAPPAGLQPPAPRAPFHTMMPWDLREDEPSMPMMPPRQLRVHVQRIIAIPPPGMNQPEQGRFIPEQNEQATIIRQVPQQHQIQVQDNDQSEDMQIQHLPLPMNLGPLGLSVNDLRAIQRSVQEQESRDEQQMDNDMQEVKTIVNSLAAAAAASQVADEKQEEVQPEARAMPMNLPMIPINMTPMNDSGEDEVDTLEQKEQTQTQQNINEEQRPHFVQPRSVRARRSIPEPLLHREKRVKRCACSCA